VYENSIALETMFYADEIRATDDLVTPDDVQVGERELKMAKSLVDMLTGDFEPEKYTDNYREALLELIERKAEGEEIKRPKQVAAGKVTDLMAALRASVEQARKDRAGGTADEEAEEEAEPAAKPARRRKAG
jgi:DNA end-binding protein Ku